jgi:hypothetical protein
MAAGRTMVPSPATVGVEPLTVKYTIAAPSTLTTSRCPYWASRVIVLTVDATSVACSLSGMAGS